MSRKTYRTAQGKTVDMGALQLKNENVRAVGNMSVNAKGDLLDANNRPIQSRNQQVNSQYRKQVATNVSDDAVISSRRSKPSVGNPVINKVDPVVPDEQSIVMQETVESTVSEPVDNEPAGLAAAIAKARAVRQEPLKTPRQQAQSSSGVKKI